MGKSLGIVLLVFISVHALAGLGVLAYGLGTGRFAEDRIDQYLATWRGEKLVPPLEEVVVEEVKESPQDAGARIETARIKREMLSRELQMQFQLLRDQAVTINISREVIEKQKQELKDKKGQFEDEVTKQRQSAEDEGFRKALSYYSGMKASQVKDAFMNMSDDEVVRYLAEMNPDTAIGILDRFREPLEQEKQLRIMSLLKEYGKLDVLDDSSP